ncbi:M20 metallopeptidase family protein [Paenibacillus agaridevorans]|uniref:M20 metallopeptidase family protein n=1 Tax=Paenibacillus agaridevorans TaxID=171404 RepID=UPI001BE494DB|nr:M20 family metallopeptidase [Paenibacillus agaridevorans]
MISSQNRFDMLAQSERLAPALTEWRRELHRFPELSLEESETAERICRELDRIGIPYRANVGGHGIIAEIGSENEGPVVALRADIDALPIQEETDLDFASDRPGLMHACGHDAHTAMLIGAAELLEQLHRQQSLPGIVRLLFQPAEEVNAGANAMILDGALQDVLELYGLHNLPTLPAGKVATKQGPLMGSVDRIEITLEGKGGHGAIPDQSIDPIVCAAAIIQSLQGIVSRELSPFEPVVVTIGSITSGNANNVIPQYAVMTGTVRTFNPEVRVTLPERIERIVNHVAEGHRCKARLKYIEQVPVLINHWEQTEATEAIIDGLIGREAREEAKPTLAGEDFSVYLNEIPGCFFWLGSGPPDNAESAYGLHHPKYTLNEECLPIGAALLAEIAVNRLQVLADAVQKTK